MDRRTLLWLALVFGGVACVGDDPGDDPSPSGSSSGEAGASSGQAGGTSSGEPGTSSGEPGTSSGAPGTSSGAQATPSLSAQRERVIVTRGTTTNVTVDLQATAVTGDITLRFAELPEGVSAAPVTVSANQTSATVSLVTAGNAPFRRGSTHAKLQVTAGELSTELSVPFIVRGAPGTHDTSFGTNGLATLPGTGLTGWLSTVAMHEDTLFLAGRTNYGAGSVLALDRDGKPSAQHFGGQALVSIPAQNNNVNAALHFSPSLVGGELVYPSIYSTASSLRFASYELAVGAGTGAHTPVSPTKNDDGFCPAVEDPSDSAHVWLATRAVESSVNVRKFQRVDKATAATNLQPPTLTAGVGESIPDDVSLGPDTLGIAVTDTFVAAVNHVRVTSGSSLYPRVWLQPKQNVAATSHRLSTVLSAASLPGALKFTAKPDSNGWLHLAIHTGSAIVVWRLTDANTAPLLLIGVQIPDVIKLLGFHTLADGRLAIVASNTDSETRLFVVNAQGLSPNWPANGVLLNTVQSFVMGIDGAIVDDGEGGLLVVEYSEAPNWRLHRIFN